MKLFSVLQRNLFSFNFLFSRVFESYCTTTTNDFNLLVFTVFKFVSLYLAEQLPKENFFHEEMRFCFDVLFCF